MNTKRKFRLVLFLFSVFTLLLSACASSKSEAIPTPIPTKNIYGDFNVHIPQKALLKNYINVAVEAEPGTECTLTYIPPMGESMQMETTAKSNGLCEWRWQIKETDTQGHARLIFTINGLSDTHFLQIFNEF